MRSVRTPFVPEDWIPVARASCWRSDAVRVDSHVCDVKPDSGALEVDLYLGDMKVL